MSLVPATKFPALSYYRPQVHSPNACNLTADVCVYGATSGGVMAAIHASRCGRSVILLAFGSHVGGMTASGLGATDIGNKKAIGGIAREFYRRLGPQYGLDEGWIFEPGAAEKMFLTMLEEAGIETIHEQHLAAVEKSGNRITAIRTESGDVYSAKVFIDATYEGDLMAMAGVSFHVGREDNSVYNEIFNGVHVGHPNHNFKRSVDPYRIEGVPASGLLPGISKSRIGHHGSGDHRIQAYNFRMCLTDRADIRSPFPCPMGYDPEQYELLARYLRTGVWDTLGLSIRMPNGKTDTNNCGAVGTDFIGANHDWPEGSYQRREEIFQEHVRYTQGLFWFLSYDSRVPAHIRSELANWGLPSDEFIETGHWPHELYIREARRMVSDVVMTEHHCVGQAVADDPIALAAYTMDSHNCNRVVLGGRAFNEGNVEMGGFSPYPISYRAIIPREVECANLVVPWALSASHIAFGSIRMEPVFMVLGHSAAEAANLAIDSDLPLQQIDYATLRDRLIAQGQSLEWEPERTKAEVPEKEPFELCK